MPLVNIVIAPIVVGMALWLINRYIPMASGIQAILNGLVVVAVWVWVLQATGLWGRSAAIGSLDDAWKLTPMPTASKVEGIRILG